MPAFRYEILAGATNGSGASVIDAPDRAAAVRELRRRGITPSKVEPVSGAEAKKLGSSNGSAADSKKADAGSQLEFDSPRSKSTGVGAYTGPRGHMSSVEMATFIRELSTAVQAGLPLVQSLATIKRQIRSPRQRAVIDHLLHDVEHGRSLSDAEASVGKPFTELTINLTRAAEASGKMGEILEQTANLLDRDLKLRRTLLQGMMYPAILAVLIIIAIAVMVGFIVPGIIKPFAGRGDMVLPVPTRLVMNLGNFVRSYWWLIGLVVAGALIGFQQLYRAPASRLVFDRWLLKLPLVGRVFRDVAVARFTRTLGTLITAGIPALSALTVTKGTLGNKAMEKVIDEVCEQVSSGKTISDPMERSGHFPSLLTQIVGLGERSGRLPQMLNQAATVFEDRTGAVLETIPKVLNILMVLVAACIIGFIMAAVLLPLIQAQDLVGR
jgi:type II secretory pathway component PulF